MSSDATQSSAQGSTSEPIVHGPLANPRRTRR
jgi:hypothetical protein